MISADNDAALRVLHVTPFFAPAWVYGGLPESAYQFARHLALAGVTVRVLTTDANGWGQRLDAALKWQHTRIATESRCGTARASRAPVVLT